MSERNWYYADHQRQNQGPLPASAIVALFRKGVLEADSLVWHEGLSEWQALSKHFAEIGIKANEADRSFLLPLEPLPVTAPAPASTATPSNRNDADIVPAGFVRRWAAVFLDSLIVSVPVTVLAVVLAIPLVMASANPESAAEKAQGLFYLLYLLVAPAYYAGMESSAHQATFGKMALGIKVVDLRGRRLGLGQALGRWFAAALSYISLGIGFLMAAFTEKKQALHDLIAGTQVVDRWAYSEHPENQKRELGGCLIAFVVGMVLLLLLALGLPVLLIYAIGGH